MAAGLQSRPFQLSVEHDWSDVELHQLSTGLGWGVGHLGPLKTELGLHKWERGCSHLNSNENNNSVWPGLDDHESWCKQTVCMYNTPASSISKHTFLSLLDNRNGMDRTHFTSKLNHQTTLCGENKSDNLACRARRCRGMMQVLAWICNARA